MFDNQIMHIITMVLTSFIFVACIIPFIKKVAIYVGAVDIPGGRHIHKKIIPKFGGIAIYFGFLLGYMIFGKPSDIMNSVLIGSFIAVLTGLVDDIKRLNALTQFIGQLIAASIVVFYGGLVINNVTAFGINLNFGIFAYPLTIFFIVGCMNCINFIDGLDGLAGGISSIYFLTIGIIGTMQGKFGLDFVLTYVMLGSCLGFLLHNFYPAKIFMGNSGSFFLGFTISIIALLGFKNVTMTSFIIPLIILAIPILDTLFAILRRVLKGEGITTGDQCHIHHQLLKKNFSVKQAVLIIYLIDILFAASSIVYFLKDRTLGYFIYGILLFIVLLFVVKTNIVFEYDNNPLVNMIHKGNENKKELKEKNKKKNK